MTHPVSEITDNISVSYLQYAETGKFSSLVTDYLANDPRLMGLVDFGRDLEAYRQAFEKMDSMEWDSVTLHKVLSQQYEEQKVAASHAVFAQIEKLREGAYCTVTAHQLNFFSGPLYVIYKAVSTINLAKKLEAAFPERKIVPVFWLGTEDHDLEEIDHFELFGKHIQWQTDQKGPAGRLDTTQMDVQFEKVAELLGNSDNGLALKALFEEAYQDTKSLAQAQFHILNHLLGDAGLVILNADHRDLKALFAPVMKRELHEGLAANAIQKSLAVLQKDWHVQAAPRDLNLFVFDEDGRSRLDRSDSGFQTPSGKTYTAEALNEMLDHEPERISPNVLLRPVHQQMVLPAVATIGGGGELAYWLQLRDLFSSVNAFYPVLLLRNSVLWLDKASARKLGDLDLDVFALFGEQEQLVKNWVAAHEEVNIDLSATKEALELEFAKISEQVELLDKGLVARVQAEKTQFIKSIDKLQGKLMKAAKDRHAVSVNQLRKLQDKLFPSKSLQERKHNFTTQYMKHGENYIQILLNTLNVMDERFVIIREKE